MSGNVATTRHLNQRSVGPSLLMAARSRKCRFVSCCLLTVITEKHPFVPFHNVLWIRISITIKHSSHYLTACGGFWISVVSPSQTSFHTHSTVGETAPENVFAWIKFEKTRTNEEGLEKI